jgi:anaerobic magnesium-protoporphyrin IX monomethyl ester cyclase
MNRKWLLDYAAALGERRLRIPFECISRADRLDDEVLDMLAEMNCRRLWIGSESGSQRILNAMCRDVTVEQIQWATRALKQRGIESGMFIMLGYEGEEIADLEETVEHLKKAAPDVFLTTVAYPIKGTEYFGKVQDRLRSDKPWEQTSDREFRLQGRRSRRFYSFATRWMVNTVALHRAKGSAGDLAGRTRAALNMTAGRLGMLLTSHETETKVLPGT